VSAALSQIYADRIVRAVDRVVGCLEGLSDEEAGWQPGGEGTNSVAGIANHVLANEEENALRVLAGLPAERDRTEEFGPATAAAVAERWAALRPKLVAALEGLDDSALYRKVSHPRRGEILAGELLMVMRGHAGEHEGEAALTRKLAIEAGREG
jgi:uncharacterized damage-inducible protein DinB